MLAVGVIEIVAGLVVAVRPSFGGYLVAVWLAGIIVNLLLQADFYDIALRDFGLLLAALALVHRLRHRRPTGGIDVRNDHRLDRRRRGPVRLTRGDSP